jgi:hypothetical protein
MAKRSNRQDAWSKGGLIAVGRRTLGRYNREIRALKPRCGAKRKSTGDPCRQIAMSNGRCYLHGGRTPKGPEFHVRQWPDGAAKNWQKKLDRKLRQIDRDNRDQAKRRREMTAEDLERHKAWHRDHQPGPAINREMRRRDRQAAAEFKRTMEQERPEAPEVLALRAKAEAIEAERDRLLAELNASDDQGVFG